MPNRGAFGAKFEPYLRMADILRFTELGELPVDPA
jgi:hypothetical protein